jgi:sugar lactone lactonase YvrE
VNALNKTLMGWLATAAAAILASPTEAADVTVLNSATQFAEGPVWYHGKLYYVEYDRNTVTTWDGRKNEIFVSDPGCGPSAVVPNTAGEFLTTCYDNGSIGRISAGGTLLPRYTQDKDGHKFIAPNDFAPDGRGGIYFTDSGHKLQADDSKVFYISAQGTITLAADNLRSTNGLAVSRDDKILYVIETEKSRVLQFSIGPDASLSEQRLFVDMNELTGHVTKMFPDGMKIDSKGQIYIGQSPRDAHAPLAGKIFVVNADAKLLRTLTLPSPQVPNLAFSPDEKTLYVTAVDQVDKVPHAGKLYSIPNL